MEVNIRAVPAGIGSTAGAVCESLWNTFSLKGEPPVTRFSVEQLATAHWFDTSAAERDFGYAPTVSIAEALSILSRQGL